MAQVVSPSNSSPITGEQIKEFHDLLDTGLRKSGLSSDLFQRTLEMYRERIIRMCVGIVCEHAEMITGLFTHTVNVNHTRTSQAMFKALEDTGCVLCVDDNSVATMPQSRGGTVQLSFFQCGGDATNESLPNEYDLRGLVPASPYALGDFNAANREFAKKYSNATLWECGGKFFHMTVNYFHRKRNVIVEPSYGSWGNVWFAGEPKCTSSTITVS